MNPKTYTAFTKATGDQGQEGLLRLERDACTRSSEAAHAGYDLVCPTGYLTKVLIAEKRLMPLDWSLLPNVKKNIDPTFQKRSDDPKDQYSVVKDWGTTGFMYRTDKIKERPKSWREFFTVVKKNGKRLTMVDSSPEVIGSIAKMLGYSYNTENPSQLDKVKRELFALKPHVLHAPLVQLRHADRRRATPGSGSAGTATAWG